MVAGSEELSGGIVLSEHANAAWDSNDPLLL